MKKENVISRTTRKAMGNQLALSFRRHDMDCANVLKDNGINEATSQGLAESHLARNGSRHSQSSSSEILTTSREKQVSSESSMLQR